MTMVGKPEQLNTREMAEVIAKVFAGFFAIAYVSGYLIVGAHLEALGIRSSGVSIGRRSCSSRVFMGSPTSFTR